MQAPSRGQRVTVAPLVRHAWSIVGDLAFERPGESASPVELNEWLSAPAPRGQGSSLPRDSGAGAVQASPRGPLGGRFRAEVSDLKAVVEERVLETTVGRWVRDGWGQLAREKTELLDRGSVRARNLARASVADVAFRLLPKLEGAKVDGASCSDSEPAASGWGRVRSVVHGKSREAIYGACRRVGVDPENLQDSGSAGAQAEAAAALPPDKYVANSAIRAALAEGDTVLVKGSWLLKRSAALPRRQELEARYPSALWKVDELMERAEAGTVALIAVSYCWCTREHPDPQEEQLRRLRDALRHLLGGTALEDAAVFLDWCSLHQRPRSLDEEAAFSRAARNVHLWYAHQGVRVWMLPSPPEGAELPAPRAERGWPTLERRLGEMVTKGSLLLDLGLAGGGEAADWQQLAAACRPRRRPPPTPEAFARELATKAFTRGEDRELVLQIYARAFLEVVVAAEELQFNELGWGDEEAKTLAAALARCRRLRKITLYGNCIGEDGAASLVQALSRIHSLQEFWLTNNPVGKSKESKARLVDAWAKATQLPDSLHI